MNTPWLEMLSNVDKMVLGSIVGSVLLAFILLVVIFSLEIKSQHDRIRALHEMLDARSQEVNDHQERLSEFERHASDAQTIMEHYQGTEKRLTKATEAIRTELEKAVTTAREYREEIEQLQGDKEAIAQKLETTQEELVVARKEIETVLKRNEFWVEQLSEVRTKHDALKQKLSMIRSIPS
jgi:chromosome segregation ATPase